MLACEHLRRKAIKSPHLVSGVMRDWDFQWQYRKAVEERKLTTISAAV
jgi:hypothetical protein